MEITKIQQSTYHENSYNVFFDNGLKIRVFTSVISDFGLCVGQELSEEDVTGLEVACECNHLEALAEEHIKELGRPVSRAEVIDFLVASGARRDIAEGTAIRLEFLKVINEKDYAWLIAGNLLKRCYGPEKIKAELFYNSVSEAVSYEVLDELPDSTQRLDWAYKNKLNRKRGNEASLECFRITMVRRGFYLEDIIAAEQRYLKSLQ